MMRSSSEPGEPSTKVIDASVGGLVWVRRRNGSWWPGRIVGLDELSEECLVSPRSGTPVKLLGREDASVDWYNLEKSKRVKAFRCGDYDKCIEKAKASAANANKKAVKYARREGAILHALEIENSLLGKDRPDFCSRINNSCDEHGKSPTMSLSSNEDENGHAYMSDEVNNSTADSKSVMELSQSGASFEEPNKLISSKDQSMNGGRRKTPNDSEDDGTEGTKRTRGLEDLGMGVVSKRKGLAGLNEVAHQDSASLCDPNKADCVSNGSPATGSKTYSSLKRKISQLPNAHEFLRRRNRRLPLTKVLESTAMVSVPVKCDQLDSVSGSPLRGISDNKLPEIEYHESKDISVMINNNLNSTVVSCENRVSYNAPKHSLDVSHVNSKRENDISGVSGLPVNDSSDKLFDVPYVVDDKSSAGIPLNLAPISSGNPENSEAVALNEVHFNDTSRSMDEGTSKWQSKGKRKSRNVSKVRKQDSTKMLEVGDEPSAYLPATEHLNGVSHDSELKLDCSGTVNSKLAGEDQKDLFPDWSRRRESNTMPLAENNGTHNLHKSRPYRQSRSTVNSRYEMSDFPSRSIQLYDVNLEVKASYRPQHVPLVSLMSKFNGKAIIGHPLTVEALDYGSCDLLTSSFADPKDNLESWYTKRNSKSERAPAKHLTLQSRYSRSKRKSGLLSKKTRKLSSLTSSHKQGEQRKPVVEKLKGPAIACIPLKLVFSRINEAVTRLTHRPSTSSNP